MALSPNYNFRTIDGHTIRTCERKQNGEVLSYSVEVGTTGLSNQIEGGARSFFRLSIAGRSKPCIEPSIKHVAGSSAAIFNCAMEGDRELNAVRNALNDALDMIHIALKTEKPDLFRYTDDFNTTRNRMDILKLASCPYCGRKMRALKDSKGNRFASCLGYVKKGKIFVCDYSDDIAEDEPTLNIVPEDFTDTMDTFLINEVEVPSIVRGHCVHNISARVDCGTTGIVKGKLYRGAKTNILFSIQGNKDIHIGNRKAQSSEKILGKPDRIHIEKRVDAKTGTVTIQITAAGNDESRLLYLVLLDVMYALNESTVTKLRNPEEPTCSDDKPINPKDITKSDAEAYVQNVPCPKCGKVLALRFNSKNGHRFVKCLGCGHSQNIDYQVMRFSHKKPY